VAAGSDEAARIVGLLADVSRRKVVAALVLGATTLVDIGREAGLGLRETVDALARLVSGGLVVGDGGEQFFVVEQAFGRAARAAAPVSSLPTDADERVVATFVRDGRLVSIPTQRAKRLVILDVLAQDFEPGLKYSEAEVNTIVSRWHEDHAALRRYLVDESLLTSRSSLDMAVSIGGQAARPSGVSRYSFSTIIAMPWPPPTHIVSRPYWRFSV